MPKYIFNIDTLSYEEVRRSRRFRMTKGAVLFAGSILMAVFWLVSAPFAVCLGGFFALAIAAVCTVLLVSLALLRKK